MGTTTIVETAATAIDSATTFLTDETIQVLTVQSAFEKDMLSEDSSMPHVGSAVSGPLMENDGYSSSCQTSMDQPTVDCKAISAASSGLESNERNALGADNVAMTIECLRARLLSERSISKSAKQQARQLAKKVMELEHNLKAEMARRRLSQIAAEQALTKLENAGVLLDSTQLDIFVREFDSRKGAPSYQDKENVARFSQSASFMNLRLKSERGSNVLDLNGHQNDSISAEVDQNPMKRQTELNNLILDRDKNGARDSDQLSENKGLDSQALLPECHNQQLVPVRGTGRSCRIFTKKDPRLANEEQMVECLDGKHKIIVCPSENENQQGPDSSDISEWVNGVSMLDGKSRSSSENGWTDRGQPDTGDVVGKMKQYSSEKDDSHSSADLLQRHAFVDLEAHLCDTSSTELLAEQKLKTNFRQNAQQSQVVKEVKKLLEHTKEFNALRQSQENVQMVWKQLAPLRSTSEQRTYLQCDFPMNTSESSTSSCKLSTAPKSMLHVQKERFDSELNSLQLQEPVTKNQKAVFYSSLRTQNSDENSSSIFGQERQSFERMTDKPSKVTRTIQGFQCVQEYKTHIPEKQFELNNSGVGMATDVLAHKDKASMPLSHLANDRNELVMDTPVDVIDCECKLLSVSNAALDTNHYTSSGSQSKDLCLAQEGKHLGSYMPLQVEADATCATTEVKYCTDDTPGDERKGIVRLSADCSSDASHRNGFNRKTYSRILDDSFSNGSVVARKGGIGKETLAEKLTQGRTCTGVFLKADLQRHKVHSKHVLDSFCNSSTSHIYRKSKQMEFRLPFGCYAEENDEHHWKPGNLDNLYKDVINRAQLPEIVAGGNKQGTGKPSVHQDQLNLQVQPLCNPFLPHKEARNNQRLLYEESITCKEKSGHHNHRREINGAPNSVPVSKHHSYEPCTAQFTSSQSHVHVTSERVQNVLMALRLAKEQIRESIDQRQIFPKNVNARNEDFQIVVNPRVYSNQDNNDPSERNIPLIPPLGYPVPRLNDEFKVGLFKDFKSPNFHSLATGHTINKFPSSSPAVVSNFKHYPLTTGSAITPQHTPFPYAPMSSYLDKKGTEVIFRR
ncbi:hypothetical protein O6H91_Y257100 [Diphasiastrum complanatum]|nr:hypothetical protein O6H91_Y257100 [Diphasiastrum complanatum]KAJ7299299.1 hypothetical protein O6H91_Y257100 [Diphasiastrum complanatum]